MGREAHAHGHGHGLSSVTGRELNPLNNAMSPTDHAVAVLPDPSANCGSLASITGDGRGFEKKDVDVEGLLYNEAQQAQALVLSNEAQQTEAGALSPIGGSPVVMKHDAQIKQNIELQQQQNQNQNRVVATMHLQHEQVIRTPNQNQEQGVGKGMQMK